MAAPRFKTFFLFPQAIVLGLATLLIWNGVSDNALYPQYMAWSAGLLVSLVLLFRARRSLTAEPPSIAIPRMLLPFAFFIVVAGASCLWTRNPWEGAFEWTKFFFCLLWIIVLQQMLPMEKNLLRNIPRILVLVAGTAITVGYVQLIHAGIQAGGLSHQLTYQVDALYAHRNLFAEALVLMFPYLVWGAIQDKGLWRVLAAIFSFCTLPLVLVLQVRSAWLAIVAGITVALCGAIYVAWKSGKHRLHWKQIGIVLLAAGIAIGLGLGIYSKTRQSGSLLEVGSSIVNPTYGSAQERKVQWGKTVELIGQRPLLGCGLNGWRVEMLATGYDRLRLESQQGKVMIDRTHNDFLQLAAETGLVGGLAWLLTILMGMATGVRTLYKDSTPPSRLFAVIPLASLTSYVVISCFSFPMERISHLILLATNLGILAMLAGEGKKWIWRPARATWIILFWLAAVIVVGGGLLGFERIKADRHLIAALNKRETKDWAGMLKTLEAGKSAFTQLDPTGTPFSWYRGSARNQLGDLQGALADFQGAYQANPYHLHVLNNLGATWVQLGYLDSGLTYCQRAVALSPRFSEAWVNLGIIHFNSNRLDLAEAALMHVQDTIPSAQTVQLAQAVVDRRIQSLMPSIEEKELKSAFAAIADDPQWRLLVYQKAKLNRLNLRKQLFLEAIYVLEIGMKTISFENADALRFKYLK